MENTSILSKPELEFINIEQLKWIEVGEEHKKIRMKILSDDHRTGDSTFILHFPQNYNSGSLNPVTHEFWEEVYILDGELTDITLNKTFGTNHYASRPPGMKHGPYITNHPRGCTMLVINRYE